MSRADQSIEMVWACGKNREHCMARKMIMSEVSGVWVRGRQRLGWMDGVKVGLGNRGMTVEAAHQFAKDQKEWKALVHN